MSQLQIQTHQGQVAYHPGEIINGTAGWSLDRPARTIELSLLWTTRGKGTVDTGFVDSLVFENPPALDSRAFAFQLPAVPYSFEGKVLCVQWMLSLIAHPFQEQAQLVLVMSPNRQVINLIYSPA